MADDPTELSPEQLEAELSPVLEGGEPSAGLGAGDRDLLHLAQGLHRRLAPPEPRAAFVAASPARLIRRIRQGDRDLRSAPAWRRWLPAASLAGVAAVAIFFGTAGAVYASDDALPGDSLYGVKRAWESVRVSLTRSPAAQAALRADLAGERLEEVVGLLEAGEFEALGDAILQYEEAIDALVGLGQGAGPTADEIAVHIEVLEGVQESAPEAALPALEHAVQNSQHGLQVLQALEEGISPSELAPGQLKKTEQVPEGEGPPFPVGPPWQDGPGGYPGQGPPPGQGGGNKTPTPEP